MNQPRTRDEMLALVMVKASRLRRLRAATVAIPVVCLAALACFGLYAALHTSSEARVNVAGTPPSTLTQSSSTVAPEACLSFFENSALGKAAEYIGLTVTQAVAAAKTRGDTIGVVGTDGSCDSTPVIADREPHRVAVYIQHGVITDAYRG